MSVVYRSTVNRRNKNDEDRPVRTPYVIDVMGYVPLIICLLRACLFKDLPLLWAILGGKLKRARLIQR